MSNSDTLEVEQLATYDDIAREYYNPKRHPTCASLHELSARYLVPRIMSLSGDERSLVEVGAGRSVLAPTWAAHGGNLKSLVLVDSSAEMLSYSAEWELLGVRLTIADATATRLPSNSVDVIVCSLGDPYNTFAFWKEAARILRPTGICHFTTPAREWAISFRPSKYSAIAEFVRADGAVLLMPSPVPSVQQQMELFQGAGLRLIESQPLTLSDLSSAPAPKLLCVLDGEPVLRGYSVRRL